MGRTRKKAAAGEVVVTGEPTPPVKGIREHYNIYGVTIKILTPLAGSVPRSPEVMKHWLDTIKGLPENVKKMELEEREKYAEEVEIRNWNSFRKDEKGYYLPSYVVRGVLKQAGDLTDSPYKVKRRAKLIRVFPDRLYLPRDPDRTVEITGHVMGFRGERDIITRVDVYDPPIELTFELWVSRYGKQLTRDELEQLLVMGGQSCGIGAARQLDYGRFEVVDFHEKSSKKSK